MNHPLPLCDREHLLNACRQVFDPEFGINVVDLGLIYAIDLEAGGHVRVRMTLTSFYCPAGTIIIDGTRHALAAVPGVTSVDVQLVWEPLWNPDLLSPEARERLGWDETAFSE